MQRSFDHPRSTDDNSRYQEDPTKNHRDTLRVVQSIKASVLHSDMVLRHIWWKRHKARPEVKGQHNCMSEFGNA